MTDKQARIKTILDQECKHESEGTFCLAFPSVVGTFKNCPECHHNDSLSARIEDALKEGEK